MTDDDADPDKETVADANDPGKPATETADSPKVKQRKLTAKQERRQREEFWRGIFSSEVGRREIWRLMFANDMGHPFETRFSCGPNGFPDPAATWYERGSQDLARRQLDTLTTIDRAGVFAMLDENDQRFIAMARNREGG